MKGGNISHLSLLWEIISEWTAAFQNLMTQGAVQQPSFPKQANTTKAGPFNYSHLFLRIWR